MKIIFILLFTLSVFGQTESRMDSIKNEFIEDSFRYDVNMKPYLDVIQEIKIKKLNKHILGNYSNGVIQLNTSYLSGNRRLLKAVFYHEVGHLIGLEHLCEVCPFIMSAHNRIDFETITKKEWEYQLSVFYGMIQELNNKNKNKKTWQNY